jgi:hypothetical protein
MNLTNRNHPPVVSETQRTLHSRAIARRDRWRLRYHDVSCAIRGCKRILSQSGGTDRFAQIALLSLRTTANDLMDERSYIDDILRHYAYPWASREAVAAHRAGQR